MSTIAVVGQSLVGDAPRIVRVCVQELGHTATVILDSAVTGSSLSAYDLIINVDPDSSTWTDLAAYYEGYMTTYSIPIVFLATIDSLSDEKSSQDMPENKLGVVATSRRTDQSYGHSYSVVGMHEDHQGTIVGAGFPVEQSFRWTNADTNVTSAAGKSTVAGVPFLELDDGEIAGSVIDSGDDRVGQGVGTFPVRAAWLGALEPENGLVLDMGMALQAAVKWAFGDYAATTTYSTTLVSAIRFPSVDIAAVGTYKDSTVDWTQTLPANTAIVVESSRDGETWATVTKGSNLPGFSLSEDLTGERLWLKVTLSTTDGVSTPVFSDLQVEIEGEGVDLTDSPIDYFAGGPLKWLTGNNAGRSIEVKEYDPTTRTMTLFVKMPQDIEVGDTFEVSAGCDKKIATCNATFSNSDNFQGEPNVPGDDVVQVFPDAVG